MRPDEAAFAGSDERERLRALDPRRSFIVQAPAGSGKTGLLVQRYLTLLLEPTVSQPEQVLAITFTRKAAGEMLQRVLAAMQQAEAGVTSSNEFMQRTLDLAGAVAAKSRELGWGLPEAANRLSLQTIDAVCLKLTRRSPITGGAAAAPRIAMEPERHYEEAFFRLVDEWAQSKDEATLPYREAIDQLLKHLDANMQELQRVCCAMLPKRYQWIRPFRMLSGHGNATAVLERSMGILQEAQCIKFRDHMLQADPQDLVLDFFIRLRNDLVDEKNATGPEFEPMRHALDWLKYGWDGIDALEWPTPSLENVEIFRQISAFLLTKSGTLVKEIGRAANLPKLEHLAPRDAVWVRKLKDSWKQARAHLDDATTEPVVRRTLLMTQPMPAEEALEILGTAALVMLRLEHHLSEVFTDTQSADFVEIGERAATVVNEGEGPDTIRHILVDEFQDTSLSQWDLLVSLTAGWEQEPVGEQTRTLFVVGDPMQSIYRFREAEVGIFIEAWERRLLGHVALDRVSLTRNFRSTRTLVEWVNRTFSEVFPSANDPFEGRVKHAAAESGRGTLGASPEIYVIESSDKSDEAKQAAEVIAREVQYLPTPDAKLAVLVPQRSSLGNLVEELAARQIPCRLEQMYSLAERPVIRDLLQLTAAILHRGNRTAWLALLRSPWCGLSMEDLIIVAGVARPDDFGLPMAEFFDTGSAGSSRSERKRGRGRGTADESVSERLLNPGVLIQLMPESQERARHLSQTLEDACNARGYRPLADLVRAAWLRLGGPCFLPEATRAADLADAEEYFRMLDEADGDEVMPSLRRLEQRLKLARTSVGPESAQVVAMTIHHSKGLEFPTVLILGANQKPYEETRPALLRWGRVREGDQDLPVIAPIRERGGKDSWLTTFLKEVDAERQMEERKRLLYVATTRAERRLLIMGRIDNSSRWHGSSMFGLLGTIMEEAQAMMVGNERQQDLLEFDVIRTRPRLNWQPHIPTSGIPWRAHWNTGRPAQGTASPAAGAVRAATARSHAGVEARELERAVLRAVRTVTLDALPAVLQSATLAAPEWTKKLEYALHAEGVAETISSGAFAAGETRKQLAKELMRDVLRALTSETLATAVARIARGVNVDCDLNVEWSGVVGDDDAEWVQRNADAVIRGADGWLALDVRALPREAGSDSAGIAKRTERAVRKLWDFVKLRELGADAGRCVGVVVVYPVQGECVVDTDGHGRTRTNTD